SFVEYSTPGTLGPEIAKWLRQHAVRIRQSRAHREQAWRRLRGLDIRRAMTLARIVQAEISEIPLFREAFVEQLAGCQDMTGTLTLLQIAHIATVQKWHLVASPLNLLAFE